MKLSEQIQSQQYRHSGRENSGEKGEELLTGLLFGISDLRGGMGPLLKVFQLINQDHSG